MFKKYFIIFLSAGLVYLSSCQKDIDYFIPDPGAGNLDTSWTANVSDSMPVSELKTSLLIAKPVDMLNISAAANFTTSSGLQLLISPTSLLTANGAPVLGNINIESALYKTKGELIRMNLNSMSDFGLLSSSGIIYLNITQNNEPLHISQGTVFSAKYAPASSTGHLNVYNGQVQTPASVYWLFNYDTLSNKVIATGNLFQLNSKSLGWLNAASLVNITSQGSGSVTVKLPVNYTNKNTTAWLVINNRLTALNFVPYAQEKTFVMGSLPENESAKIIIMSKQAGEYYFAQKEITITATGYMNPVFITPVISTLDNIKGYLNSL